MARQCDDCGSHMGAYEPRKRVEGRMLCPACVASPRGGLVSATAASGQMVAPDHPEDEFKVMHRPATSRQPEHYLTYLHPYSVKIYPPDEPTDSWKGRYFGPGHNGTIDLGDGLDVHEHVRRMREELRDPGDDVADKMLGRFASADHDVLYHITDRHHFALDPEYAPQDNSFAIEDRSGRKGLYLTDSPDRWRATGYHRPYVAEVHVPKGLAQDGRWHGEKFLPAEHYDQATVPRVMPFDEHQRERWGGTGTIEDGLGSPASTTPGKDVRDFTPEEHTEHLRRFRDFAHDVQRWGWNEFNDQHEHVGVEEEDHEGMPVRRDRDGNVMTGGRYAKRKSLPKTQKCEYCDDQATKRLLWAEGMAYIPTCDAHETSGRRQIEGENKDEVVGVKPIEKASTRKVAHDSGDGMTIYHCPFCGSGQVIARSDRSIECQFCHTSFTVQVQPEFSNFPQTVDGMPVQVPGMPGQIGGPEPVPGQEPMPGQDPMDPDAPVDPNALDEDGSEPPEEAEDDSEGDAPPWAKASMLTPSGVRVDGVDFVNHVAFAITPDRGRTAALVRARRRAGR